VRQHSRVKGVASLTFGFLVGGVLALWVIPAAAAQPMSCPGDHPHVEEKVDSVYHAGMGVAANGIGSGLYLGAINVTCARVTSIFVVWDGNNYEELGALQQNTSYFACPSGVPADSNWYRFWVKFYTGTCSASTSFAVQSANTYHEADVDRSESNNFQWILHWDYSTWTTLTGSKTSGLSVAGAERVVSGDSMYSEYDGAQWEDKFGVWHTFGSVLNYCDQDDTYDLVTTPAPDHFYVQVTTRHFTSC